MVDGFEENLSCSTLQHRKKCSISLVYKCVCVGGRGGGGMPALTKSSTPPLPPQKSNGPPLGGPASFAGVFSFAPLKIIGWLSSKTSSMSTGISLSLIINVELQRVILSIDSMKENLSAKNAGHPMWALNPLTLPSRTLDLLSSTLGPIIKKVTSANQRLKVNPPLDSVSPRLTQTGNHG